MRGVNLIAALAAAIGLCCLSQATLADDIEWIGGANDWDLGQFRNNTTNTTGDAQTILGRTSGWQHRNSVVPDARLTIGAGADIFYDGNLLGDWHWSSRRTGNYGPPDGMGNPTPILAYDNTAGGVTLQDGARLTINSGPGGDVDGIWSQFDGDELKITGEGTLLQRTRTPDGAGNPFTAGAFVFGSWRSRDFGPSDESAGPTIKLTVEDRGTLINDGSINFGADGDNPADLKGIITVGEGGNILLFNGAAVNEPIDDAPCYPAGFPCEGNLNFVYGYDQGTAALKGEQYTINFTGHGGSIETDETGIWIQEETGVEDQVGLDDNGNPNLIRRYSATNVTYEQLYAGVSNPNPDDGNGSTIGANFPTKQILQSNGSNAAAFGDVFAVQGTLGQSGYRVASIMGAGEGGAFRSDINGDLFVDGADAGQLIANLGASGADAVLANGDILDDDVIDGADAGRMIADFNTAYDGHLAPAGATARYNRSTGEISVWVDNVSNWYVEAIVEGIGNMTGPDDAGNVLPAGGGNYAGNEFRAGELNFGGSMTYHVDLGAIAGTKLPDGSVRIWFNGGGGGSQDLQPGLLLSVPEPMSLTLVGLALFGLGAATRRRSIA